MFIAIIQIAKYNGKGRLDLKRMTQSDAAAFYDGDWKEGKRNGSGTELSRQGDKYTGSFSNDKKHGAGKLVYKDGSSLKGEWRDDVLFGKVSYHCQSGESFVGNYVNG